jgi:hypothetical protein
MRKEKFNLGTIVEVLSYVLLVVLCASCLVAAEQVAVQNQIIAKASSQPAALSNNEQPVSDPKAVEQLLQKQYLVTRRMPGNITSRVLREGNTSCEYRLSERVAMLSSRQSSKRK